MLHERKNWSDQIQAYQNGSLSNEDRFQLEKAALDDPFLFDALEGYTLYSHTKSDKAQKPGPAKQGTKLFSLRNISIAASVVLLVGMIGYMSSITTESDTSAGAIAESTTIDRSDNKAISMNTAVQQEAIQSSASSDENESELEIAPKQVQKQNPKSTKTNSTSSYATKPTPNKEVEMSKINSAVAQEIPIRKESNDITKVSDDVKSTISSSKKRSAVLTDAAEESNKPSLALKPTSSRSNRNKTLTLDQAETITLGEAQSVSFTATPALGWSNFSKYVRENKKDISLLKPVSVKLNFKVGTTGSITEVTSNTTGCKACELDAIRLIKESGIWKNATGKVQTISYEIKY